jgi:hypothetical protein
MPISVKLIRKKKIPNNKAKKTKSLRKSSRSSRINRVELELFKKNRIYHSTKQNFYNSIFNRSSL